MDMGCCNSVVQSDYSEGKGDLKYITLVPTSDC